MGKRNSMDIDGATVFQKRQKITHDIPTSEDVSSGDQLRKLLVFDQDMRQASHGLQSLKRLLDDILSGDNDRNAKLSILQEYLDLVRPRDINEDAVFLNDVMETWSFAAQVNNHSVMSSVAVVLALVLHIVSESLDLVKHGLGICQSLLQERQLKSISRNLSSEKARGFIISPTLRLLREAVCLDGGAFAKRIVRARTFTFASLGRNLEVGNFGDNQDDARKASVRTNAVRFFLSCLKYLHSDGKKELLSQKELLSHLTFMIKSDPPYLVLEILDVLKTYVLADSKINREVKFKCFNTKTLMRFLSLYSYSYSSATVVGDREQEVSEKSHQFLIYACTTPIAGILYPSTGLYPKEVNEEFSVRLAKQSNQGHDTVARFRDGIPVFNFVLSDFAANIRPWYSLKHNELLIAIFKAAPELIADYFFSRSFTLEPKLSMIWIGYSAFLFDAMRIPIPPSFGDKIRYARAPPPTSILLNNILPLPINQKVLVRCLSLKSNLTSFFATRILVEALEKLSTVVRMHEEAFRSSDAQWSEAARRLVDAFCQRIPNMKEIVRSYKAIPSDNTLHKLMTSRVLRLYYEVIPQIALVANFDVSPFFVDILQSLHDGSNEQELKAFGIMELENLVSIASYSPGMRWFARIEILSGGSSTSPFAALLRLLCGSDQTASVRQLKKVLADVAVENQLVSEATGLKPLLQALRCVMAGVSAKEMEFIWTFLDNCVGRCATAPIKYLDILETYLNGGQRGLASSNSDSLNLLAVTLAEQLPYLTSTTVPQEKAKLARFLFLYFNALHTRKGSDEAIICTYRIIQEHLSSHSAELRGLGDRSALKTLNGNELDVDEDSVQEQEMQGEEAGMGESQLEEMLHVPFSSQDDTAVLLKWHSKSVEDLIEDGWAASLIRLLASRHTNLRKEALTNILKMAAKIEESSYEEKKQFWLLLSELVESSRSQTDIGPVPSALTAFAIHALEVLRNPLHPLYPKINAFLTRSPVWLLEKLPLAHDILHGEPSEDDRYYTEITWFLTYILDSLKTSFDVGVFHKKRWFEKILALGSNPYLRSNLRMRMLRILYRVTCIDSGSTTLITRFGLLSWLDAQRIACDIGEDADLYGGLMKRAWQTCDQKRVTAWSKGGVQKLLESVQG